MSKQKVIVGMSGGVDSSVAAYLLIQQGYAVEGLFMKNWEEDDTDSYCAAETDIADAQSVCDALGIPLHRINFAAEYWDNVFEHFLSEYRAGRTPNPDILCNKEIKFKAFYDYAKSLGAHFIATGHYARRLRKGNRSYLLKGCDPSKDQSYFLYGISQEALSNTLFPVGDLLKSDLRALAEKIGLGTHNKKDSTGICFIGERRFKQFLSDYIPHQPGLIETSEGDTIGRHDGLMYYTLGQRQGLGIGGIKASSGAPWYVADKDLARNVLIVVQGQDHPRLYQSELLASQLNWLSDAPSQMSFNCSAKTRYRQEDKPCTVEQLEPDRVRVRFEAPQWAITAGQSVVFYAGETCLGGGIIE